LRLAVIDFGVVVEGIEVVDVVEVGRIATFAVPQAVRPNAINPPRMAGPTSFLRRLKRPSPITRTLVEDANGRRTSGGDQQYQLKLPQPSGPIPSEAVAPLSEIHVSMEKTRPCEFDRTGSLRVTEVGEV